MTTPAPEVIEREKNKLYVTDAELIRRIRIRLMDRWGASLEEWTSAKRFSTAPEFTECLGIGLAHWELLIAAGDLPRGQVRWEPLISSRYEDRYLPHIGLCQIRLQKKFLLFSKGY